MSKLGYYNPNSPNNFYSIYTSDLNVANIMKLTNLPVNSIIISSPINKNGDDMKCPAILMTDGDGKPLPLTYNFSSEDFTVNESTNTVSLKKLSSIEDRLNKLEIEVFSSPAPAPTSTFTPF